MGLFSKKKKVDEIPAQAPGLPELPPANNDLVLPTQEDLPDVPAGLPQIETTENVLPTLPNSEEETQFQQQMVKQEITQPEPIKQDVIEPEQAMPIQDIPETVPETMQDTIPKTPIIQAPPTTPKEPRTLELSPSITHRQPIQKPVIKKVKPVYIRLDKFQTTTESFNEIKSKVTEIEETLRQIKDIKAREEEELTEWEREIQVIKSRIEFIDKNIFNRLD